jgi:hypothetical protein
LCTVNRERMGSAGSKALEIAKAAETTQDETVRVGVELLRTNVAHTEQRLSEYKKSTLDANFCKSEGWIPVDQVVTELQEVYVTTTKDTEELEDGVNSIIDSAFSANIQGFIKAGVKTALLAVAGASKGTMSVKKTYILTLTLAGTHPSISVVNLYLFNYKFEATGLFDKAESVMGYCVIHGSVGSGMLHRGTLQTLLVDAQTAGVVTDANFEAIREEATKIYCASASDEREHRQLRF